MPLILGWLAAVADLWALERNDVSADPDRIRSRHAAVTAAQKQGTSVTRITCTYDGMDEDRLGRLEFGLFDAALSRLGS